MIRQPIAALGGNAGLHGAAADDGNIDDAEILGLPERVAVHQIPDACAAHGPDRFPISVIITGPDGRHHFLFQSPGAMPVRVCPGFFGGDILSVVMNRGFIFRQAGFIKAIVQHGAIAVRSVDMQHGDRPEMGQERCGHLRGNTGVAADDLKMLFVDVHGQERPQKVIDVFVQLGDPADPDPVRTEDGPFFTQEMLPDHRNRIARLQKPVIKNIIRAVGLKHLKILVQRPGIQLLGREQHAAHQFNTIFDIHCLMARLPGRTALDN